MVKVMELSGTRGFTGPHVGSTTLIEGVTVRFCPMLTVLSERRMAPSSLFTLQGRTIWVEDKGRQLLSVIFEAEDSRYKWLNNTFCVLEGVINPSTLTYAGKNFCLY